jgi:hypothetical protein
MVNDVEIKAGEFTLWLRCDGLDRAGAGKVAFVLEFVGQVAEAGGCDSGRVAE